MTVSKNIECLPDLENMEPISLLEFGIALEDISKNGRIRKN